MRRLEHITETCRKIYEKEGFSAVCDYVNKMLERDDPMPNLGYEFCKACNTDAPEWNHICLACGQPTELRPEISDFEKLREQAQEMIDGGNSHEKAEGHGMMIVLNHLRPMPNNLYFELMSIGKNKDLDREEIQIHCGENGNLMIAKTPEGFVIDIYNQDELVDTMCVWEDDLTPLPDEDDELDNADITNEDIAQFKKDWGQTHSGITAELGYPRSHEESDGLLMEDFFWIEKDKRWYNKCASGFTEKEQRIADYLRNLN